MTKKALPSQKQRVEAVEQILETSKFIEQIRRREPDDAPTEALWDVMRIHQGVLLSCIYLTNATEEQAHALSLLLNRGMEACFKLGRCHPKA